MTEFRRALHGMKTESLSQYVCIALTQELVVKLSSKNMSPMVAHLAGATRATVATNLFLVLNWRAYLEQRATTVSECQAATPHTVLAGYTIRTNTSGFRI